VRESGSLISDKAWNAEVGGAAISEEGAVGVVELSSIRIQNLKEKKIDRPSNMSGIPTLTK
jgi:hypothetical protein